MKEKIILINSYYNEFWLESDGLKIFLFHYQSYTKEKNEDSYILKRTEIIQS